MLLNKQILKSYGNIIINTQMILNADLIW